MQSQSVAPGDSLFYPFGIHLHPQSAICVTLPQIDSLGEPKNAIEVHHTTWIVRGRSGWSGYRVRHVCQMLKVWGVSQEGGAENPNKQ